MGGGEGGREKGGGGLFPRSLAPSLPRSLRASRPSGRARGSSPPALLGVAERLTLRATFVVALVGAIVLALAPAQAGHCTTWSTSENDDDTIVFYNPAANLYHIWDWCQPQCLFSYWAYEESNGLEGLQRGDEVVDDTCHSMIESDTWFY